MGGFMINGIGAADSFYKLKELKVQYCNYCHKEQMFALMEVKRKIRLIYIPTVSISTKYGVTCTKCKTGFYISEEEKNLILSHPASRVTIGDGFVKVDPQEIVLDAAPLPEPKPEKQDALPEPKPLPAPQPEQEPEEEVRTCRCGAVLYGDDLFCPQCGSRIEAPAAQPIPEPVPAIPVEPEAEKPAPVEPIVMPAPEKPAPDLMAAFRRRKICPCCRLMFAPDKEVCGICGSPLELKT